MADYMTRLPSEVIQQVASLCSFRDVLAIGWTCRQFRRACEDAFVLQWCFLNQIYGPTPKQVRNNDELRKLIASKLASRPPEVTTAIWARLAAASSGLPQFLDDLEDLLVPYESVPWDDVRISNNLPTQLTPAGRNTIGMLSTWTVLCSPTVNNFPIAASLSGLAAHMLTHDVWDAWDRPSRATLASQISFCLAMGVLGHPVLNNMPILVRRAMDLYSPEAWGDRPSIQSELNLSFQGRQAVALLTLCCLPWILRSDPGLSIRNDLPHPADLPLLQPSGDIPLPDNLPEGSTDANTLAKSKFGCRTSHMGMFMCAPSWVNWLRSNVDGLIEDITDGEWMAYVSTSQGRNGEVPPPSRGIQFTRKSPKDKSLVLLEAHGAVDGRGEFLLDGHVEPLTGRVELLKRWTGSAWPPHAFVGTVTPLGIAGYWSYGSAQGVPRGFMWMYKKEWVRERS
ncbi:hypothetical protein QBC34DRAFT_437262 [Podospora aff. communis PSN243]|uniref:F-box domain-containing protein n=1 Tax=Podospora aff. communis PSN243 TaxID=3040156 RepID=A0AAV9GRM8_9PEZI|nr:hypothetical protein QBC34DRAFT_437262 [Podospora aff. communis PSN243]